MPQWLSLAFSDITQDSKTNESSQSEFTEELENVSFQLFPSWVSTQNKVLDDVATRSICDEWRNAKYRSREKGASLDCNALFF